MAMNERYVQPAMRQGVEEDIIKGLYLFQSSKDTSLIQLMGSGAILNEVVAAAALLKDDFNIAANVWSVTSFGELRRDGENIERTNMLTPQQKPVMSYVETCLKDHSGPIVAAT